MIFNVLSTQSVGTGPFLIGSLIRGWSGWRDRFGWVLCIIVAKLKSDAMRTIAFKKCMRHIRCASCNSPQLLHRPSKGIVHNPENCITYQCSALDVFNVFKWMSDWLVRLTSASHEATTDAFLFGLYSLVCLGVSLLFSLFIPRKILDHFTIDH